MTHLEDSLREYYSAQADSLSLPDRVFDSVSSSDDASVSYISMGPETRRRAPILLAAAASIALVTGAGVLVTRSSPVRGPRVVSSATTVPPSMDMPLFAATWLPDGYLLTGASDSSDNSYPAHTLIYRDRSQPLGSPAILISVDSPLRDFPGSEITIQGRTALDASTERNPSIVMTDPSGVGISLSGRGIDLNQLRQVAETVKARSASPADGIDVGGFPPGFAKVGDYVGTTNGRMVDIRYQKPGSPDEQISVGVSNFDLGFEEILGAMGDTAPTPVIVRGHQALQIHVAGPFKQTTVAWNETAQAIVAVYSPDAAPEVLLKVAEGLRTISSDELKHIVSMSEPPGIAGANGSAPPAAPTTFTCAEHDATAPEGQRKTACSDVYQPPLWAAHLPEGFGVSQIERTVDAPSDRWMLQYTTGAAGTDGANDILMFIEQPPPTGLDGFRSSVTSQPLNGRVVTTTIRGHDALIFSDPTGQNRSVGLAWMETPTQLVSLESSRAPIYELRQLAEGLAPLSSEDWTTKIARNEELLKGGATTPTGVATDVATTSTTAP